MLVWGLQKDYVVIKVDERELSFYWGQYNVHDTLNRANGILQAELHTCE